MKNILTFLLLISPYLMNAQGISISFVAKQLCSTDTVIITYRVKNATTIKWLSSYKGGYFKDKFSSVSDSINYFIITNKPNPVDPEIVLKAVALNGFDSSVYEQSPRANPDKSFDLIVPEKSVVNMKTSISIRPFWVGVEFKEIAWDFGDGTTIKSTDTLHFHEYKNPGIYLVKVCAYTVQGCKECYFQEISIDWPASIQNIELMKLYNISLINNNLTVSDGLLTEVSLYSISGKLLFASHNTLGFNYVLQPNQIYFLQFRNEDMVHTIKILSK